jgi:hypothetical protein
MTLQQFIKKCKPAALTERATAQSHFINLTAKSDRVESNPSRVMRGLVPRIHVFLRALRQRKTWVAGTSPAMTIERLCRTNGIGRSAHGAGTSESSPPGFAGEALKADEAYILGRGQFAKISEVEGVRLSDAAKEAFAEFDRKGLPAEERRRAIIGMFKPIGK